MATYEIWVAENMSWCIQADHHTTRATDMQEPGARLVHSFAAETLEECKAKWYEFRDQWYLDPEGTETLNIPASHFQISEYPCGLKVGDVLRLEEVYVEQIHEETYHIGPKGSRFRVAPGDKNIPHTVFMRRLDDEVEQHHYVDDNSPFFQLYRKEK